MMAATPMPIPKMVKIARPFLRDRFAMIMSINPWLQTRAYLDSIPEITIDAEPLFTNKGVWHRPDFVIKQKDDSVILEVKGSRRPFHSIKKEAELQTLLLLEAANISSGVVFIYTPDLNKVIGENKVEYGRPLKDHQIVYIYPKN